MATSEEEKIRDEASQSLERIQSFDLKSLSREKELGITLAFNKAIEPSRRLINLFKQVSINILEDLPQKQLNQLKDASNSIFSIFEEILKFTTEQPNPHEMRKNLLNQLTGAYQSTFDRLQPIISYSTSRSADFKRLEMEARATMQSVKDHADELTKVLENNKKESQKILDNIRKVAAEQGVSQQALYFKEVSDEHNKQSKNWQKVTIYLSIFLGFYSALSIFLHKIPFLKPTDSYDTIQLAVSKILIFAVITYMLYLAAKNFLAHKHNEIINNHRQTALMTYKALVDAATDTDNKEIVLTHASACIFSPQNTGYGKEASSSAPTAKSVVELLAKPFTTNLE